MLADQCKYAFGERIHAGTTCLHSCARRAGVGWGLNRKLELRPKRHELIFGGIPSSLVIHPKRKPFSHAFGFGFGKTAVSASELCSVVLIVFLGTRYAEAENAPVYSEALRLVILSFISSLSQYNFLEQFCICVESNNLT